MKKLLFILPFLILVMALYGCKQVSYVPTETKTEIRYKDTTIYHQDTIVYTIPMEVYMDYSSLLDTLHLSTKYSESYAYVDTNAMLLKGYIQTINNEIPISYIYKDRIIKQDTTIYKEVPIYKTEYVTDKKQEVLKDIWKYLCLLSMGMIVILFIMWKLKL